MIQLATPATPKVENLARAVLTMLTSADMSQESRREQPRDELDGSGPTGRDADYFVSDANLAQLAGETLAGRSLSIAVGDWDALFCAVEARLRMTVGERLATTPAPQPHDDAGRVQIVVLECVAALEQLHRALTYERGLRLQLEQEISLAQAALTRALANATVGTPEADER